tara:strand:- start:1009 stop:1989 length:981 start_codon:yes stop_codon:yes gene_type:complete
MNNFTNLSHLSPEIINLAQELHRRQQAEQPSQEMRRLFPALDITGFTAEAVDLFHCYDQNGTASMADVPHNVGRLIRRTDTNQPLGVVGERYAIAQNQDLATKLAEGCEAALPTRALQNIELREHTSRNGRFSRFEYSFPELGADIRQLTGRSTQLKFRVAVANGFSGTSIRCQAGAIDWYCTNGMTFGEFETSVFRHTAGFNPNKVKQFVTLEAERFKERVSIWQRWALNEINPAEAELALEEAGMAGRTVKGIMEQFDIEAQERGATTWALYSALTYRSSHNSERFGVRNSSNVDNVAEVLDRREREVGQLIAHPAMQRVGMAA